MAAILQTSVLAPHLAPRMTSGDRYCLVWMSLVKWWLTQQALPRSAILTLMISKPWASSALRLSPADEDPDDALSSEIPETSLVRMSLLTRCQHLGRRRGARPHTRLTQSFPVAFACRRPGRASVMDPSIWHLACRPLAPPVPKGLPRAPAPALGDLLSCNI